MFTTVFSNTGNGLAMHHFAATYYVGPLGEMEDGFEGNVQMKVYGWYSGSTIEYATIHCTTPRLRHL